MTRAHHAVDLANGEEVDAEGKANWLRADRWLTRLPENIEVTLLADRGFGYAELYDELSWLVGFIVRFRENIPVGR